MYLSINYIQLSEMEERQFQEEVKAISAKEGEKIMEVMNSYERKGMEKGKIAAAKKMLEKGIDIEEIADLTELPVEDVERLKKDL